MMHTKTKTSKSGWGKTLLLAMVVGCVSRATVSPITTPPPPPTATAEPLPTSAPEAMTADTAGHLVSQWIASPPVIDGQVDAVWENSVPFGLPLTWGLDRTEHALDMKLQSLHTDEAVYFLAQWIGEPPSGDGDIVANQFTFHWRIPDAEERRLDCFVACHTAFFDGQGRFAYANAETIPHGGSEALPASGGWFDGTWTLEWSRPLINGNPFDLQFADLDRTYLFFAKVFERVKATRTPFRGDIVWFSNPK